MILELWAVIDKKTGGVLKTRGGSSTSPRIMVYESPGKAQKAFDNRWTQQVHGDKKIEIVKIYSGVVR